MDDFENDYDELPIIQDQDDGKSISDKYNDIKDKKEKLENLSEKLKNKSNAGKNSAKKVGEDSAKKAGGEATKKAGGEAAKKAGGEAAKKAGGEAAKTAGKEAAKTAGKEAAKTAGKEAAKAVGKEAIKTGAKVAAEGALTATGVGAIVAAGIEVADQLNKVRKKIQKKTDAKFKELTGIDAEQIRKHKFLILIIIVFSIIMLMTSIKVLATEQLTTDLQTLIERREARNTKSLIRFSDLEYINLIGINYKDLPTGYTKDTSEDSEYKDPSYNRMLTGVYSENFTEFLAGNEVSDNRNELASANVLNYVQAEKYNFNKTKWKASKHRYNYSESNEDISKDKKPTLASTNTSDILANSKITSSNLNIPSLSQYDIEPGSDTAKKEDIYVDMLSKYMQKWFIPYTMMIDTQSSTFIKNEVMNKMYNPVDVTLYEINRDTKNTITSYYLQSDVVNKESTTTETYEKVETTIETRTYDEVMDNPFDESSNVSIQNENIVKKTTTSDPVNTAESVVSEKDISRVKSNTKDNPVKSEVKSSEKPIIKEVKGQPTTTTVTPNSVEKEKGTYAHTEVKTTTTIIKGTKVTKSNIQETTTNGEIALDSNGSPMVESIKITRSIKPYRYIPKITYLEGFYEIINARYSVEAVNESITPKSKSETPLTTVDENKSSITKTEIWDENIKNELYEVKDYKVSYYSKEGYETLNRKVSRVEWYQDYGNYLYKSGNSTENNEALNNEIYPAKVLKNTDKTSSNAYTLSLEEAYNSYGNTKGYSYDDMYFAYGKIEEYYKNLKSTNTETNINLEGIPVDGFAWPVEITATNPGTNSINCIFGVTPAYGSSHTGIDISPGNMRYNEDGLTKGPQILAAHDGVVTRTIKSATSDSQYDSSTGTFSYLSDYNHVVLKTIDGSFTTVYGHLSEVNVNVGDTIKRGQVIGRMGTTGYSTGVHLHFELIDSTGERIDPLNYYVTEPEYGSIDRESITSIPSGYKYLRSKTLNVSGSTVISDMISKTIELAGNKNILYRETGRQLATTVVEINAITQTDSSGFINSIFKTYLNIDVGSTIDDIKSNGDSGYSENGWTAQIGDVSADHSNLQAGDILWQSDHVGMYIGDGKQVDLSGPGGSNSEADINWKGPTYDTDLNGYTKYIRYVNANAITGVSEDDIMLMAKIIAQEAGYEMENCLAVAAVIANRVKSNKFPNTVREVIYPYGDDMESNKSQWASIGGNQFNETPDKSKAPYQSAKKALAGEDPTNGALYFYGTGGGFVSTWHETLTYLYSTPNGQRFFKP